VFEKIRHLVSPTMPFVNLPDTHKSRWGDELTVEKMKECVWLRPEAVAQIEFLEWTEATKGIIEDTRPRIFFSKTCLREAWTKPLRWLSDCFHFWTL